MVIAVAAVVVALSGCDPCEPDRCGDPAVLLTVRDGGSLEPLPDAIVEFVPDDPVLTTTIEPTCERPTMPCTHTIWSVPTSPEHLDDADPEPGHGDLKPGVTIPFTLRVSRGGFVTREVELEIRANDCGLPSPRHYTIDLLAPGAGEPAAPTFIAAPEC